MDTMSTIVLLDRMLEPVTDCLTPEAAQRLVTLQADPSIQARVDELADRNSEGVLTPDERTEYELYVRLFDFLAILKARARVVLSQGGAAR